jgi:hypothetical protein
MIRRPADVCVRHEIRPVDDIKPGLEPLPPNGWDFVDVVKRDSSGRHVSGPDGNTVTDSVHTYEGKHSPLGYLAGEVIPLIRDIFERQGTFYLALYELEEILIASAARIHVIPAHTVLENGKWDARNTAVVTAMARENLEIDRFSLLSCAVICWGTATAMSRVRA